MKKILLGLLLSGICLVVQAQSKHNLVDNRNGWYMYFGDHQFAKKWGVHVEAQFRRSNVITDPQQLLLRTGINYHLADNAFATVGYCFVETHPYGALPAKSAFPENRFWEQLQVKTPLGRVEMINRLRLEQRLVNNPVLNGAQYEPGDAVYSNRMRILNRFSAPLKGKKIVDGSFYLSIYDEIMTSFGKNVGYNVFDQNRAYIALGYKIPKVGRLEVGYMNQLIAKSNGVDVENNHTLQVGLSSNVPLRKF